MNGEPIPADVLAAAKGEVAESGVPVMAGSTSTPLEIYAIIEINLDIQAGRVLKTDNYFLGRDSNAKDGNQRF